ncbi:MAG: HlyD family efflux transporter periplasmic adaptor subunit [Sphingomonadaceae bacterium]|nr:HlyD family efflux transporter periplasmic adaptor subunit [Sphingomonadaceae bacterium]
MSRQVKLALAVLAGAILIAVLMVQLRSQPEGAPREERAPLVQTVPLKTATEPLAVLGSGTVQPSEEVSVSAQISGRLVYVNPQFREGSLLRSGATLFRIDPSDYQNRVRSARADVAAQDVAVLTAREEARIAQDELNRFANRTAGGGLTLQTTGGDDLASRILPPHKLEDKAGAETGQSKPGAPTSLATREPQLRSAKAARERSAAQLADARLALGRTNVRAPFTGLVRSESVAVGKLVQPGQELGSIVSAATYEVRVAFSEREAALIPGLLGARTSRIPASVYLDYGGQTWRWSAHVDRADSILDPRTRTIDVFLRVPNPLRSGVKSAGSGTGAAPPLLLGSFVRAEIRGGSNEPFMQIPVEALRPGNKIWAVRDGRLRILPVRVLQRTDRVANITTATLSKGGHVIVNSLRAPVDGMRVRIEKPAVKTAKPAGKPARVKTDD